ncbi:hypothetical protein ACEPAG_9245 [Sanghuangporus baumii]
MTSECSLQVIRLIGLRWDHPLHSRVPDLYVEVELGNATRKTRTIKQNISPSWNEHLVFSFSDKSASFNVKIKYDSSWLSDPCVGLVDVKLSELLKKSAEGEAVFRLSSFYHGATTPAGLIVLRLEVIDSIKAVEINIENAIGDIHRRGIMRSDKLEVVREVGDALSEIHPFVTVAWSLVSYLYEVVDRVFQIDEKLVNLVINMRDAFMFVSDVQSLSNKVANLQGPITGLLKQTIECCLFVRQYTSETFLRRMLDADSSQKVNEFEGALEKLKKEIDSGVALHTAFVSMRTSEGINDLLSHQRLNPSTTTTFGRPVCFPETRVEARKQIIEWAFSDDARKIFWMHGVAGSGKGTVCTTIANHLRDMCRLGALLVFERGKSDPSSVIRTIAYKLALFDSSIGSRILSETEKDKDIVSASSRQQFNKLLLQPLLAVADSIHGPVVIILDALDECGTPDSRHELMELFQRDFSKLPSAFRLLITSRREPDINMAFSFDPELVHAIELDYKTSDSQHDVISYLRSTMHTAVSGQVEIPEEWPWDENMMLLGNAADGLFIWAATAVNLVSVSDNPLHTLKELVSDSRSIVNFGLDELYDTVLRSSGIAWSSEASRSRFRAILAFVLLSKAPLSYKSIDDILGFPSGESSVLILSRLQSVLSYSADEPVSIFHASFTDYLLSPDRSSDPWFIDAAAANRLIVERCLFVMEDLLRFNICGLKSSFDCNDDVTDLVDRVKAVMPSHLEYACTYWAQHLLDTPYSSDIHDKLSEFAYQRLLFWLETLSLVKRFDRIASRALRDAAGWVENATHVYISMLPLSKDDSQAAAHYSKHFSSLIRIDRKGTKKPFMCLKVIGGYAGEIWSIASSPDGRRILSGTTCGYLRVRVFDSTVDVFPAIKAHESHIWSVGFSPDGCRIVSSSEDCTIKVHDAHTGRLIHGPLKAHSAPVRKVVFSSGGTKMASGSDDGMIILWDIGLDEKVVPAPSRFKSGHIGGILSFAFSSDDTRLVSGSCDRTIKVWDIESQDPIYPPLVGHTDDVYSVVFSQDGKQIFSASADNTIRVWKLQGRQVTSTTRRRTLRRIVTAAFSPCRARVVVGFYD